MYPSGARLRVEVGIPISVVVVVVVVKNLPSFRHPARARQNLPMCAAPVRRHLWRQNDMRRHVQARVECRSKIMDVRRAPLEPRTTSTMV